MFCLDLAMKTFRKNISYFSFLYGICLIYGYELYNHSTAQLNCLEYGGLLPNTNIARTGYLTSDSVPPDALHLQDGDSAWISGYAEYSNFISWQGCYKEKGESVNKDTLPNNGLTECLKFCTQFTIKNVIKVKYIGIQNNVCYCLDTKDLSKKIKAINDTECIHQKPYNIKFNFTGSTDFPISIYQTFNQTLNSSQNLRQCLYVKQVAGTVMNGTSSCYTNNDNVTSFICINGTNSRLNNTCKNFSQTKNESPAFCLEHESTNWISANKRCNELSGKLTNITQFSSIQTRMSLKEKYWTGLFRSFEVKMKASAVCLAVTKLDNKLVLDPDDCSKKKKHICVLSSISTVSTAGPSSTRELPVTATSTEKNNTTNEVLYIAVAVALVAVAAVVACLAVRRLKKKPEHQILRENTSASLNNDGDIPADVNTAGDECAEPILRESTQKIKPKKPLRQTLRKQNCNTPYENFKLKSVASGNSENSLRKVSEDYDKVDLKCGKLKLLDNHEQDENHIYDHTTVEEDSENYDTIKSTKSRQFDSVTYSTLQRKCGNASEKNKTFPDIEKKENDKQLCDEAHDNNAYDAMDEIRTIEMENVLHTEIEAGPMNDSAN